MTSIDKENEYYKSFTSGLDCNFYVYKGKTKEEQHQEMLERRSSTIGASDVGKIMNLSPYGCSTLVYLEKKGLIAQKEETWAMKRGKALEPVVLEVLRERHPHLNILEGNKIVCLHKEYDFMQCNVDAIIIHPDGSKEGLEIKNISPFNKSKWENGVVPDDYYAQCQFSMMITGLKLWRLAVSFDCDPVEYYIEYDNEFIHDVSASVLNFKMMLDANQRPPVDPEYYDEETFLAVYPEGVKQKDCVLATEEIGKVMLELAELNKQAKDIEAKIKYLKPLAEFYMAEKDGTLLYKGEMEVEGEIKPIEVSARMQTTSHKPKFSLELLKEKHPDFYAKVESECTITPKPSRSFGWLKSKGLD